MMKSRVVAMSVMFGAVAGIARPALSDVTEGTLPSAYQLLDYIVSHGDEWIDTGICPSKTTACTVDVMPLVAAAQTRFFISRQCKYESMSGYLYFEVYANGSMKHAAGLTDGPEGKWKANSQDSTVRVGSRFTIGIDAPNKKLTVNGNLTTLSPSSVDCLGQSNLLLMAHGFKESNPQPGFVGRLYGAKVWESGVLVRDLVPCRRRSDGAVGLYDLADHSSEVSYVPFYPNAGDGCLDAGLPAAPLSLTVSGETATLVCEPADEARTLFLAYGNSDGGEQTNGWEHVVESVAVPAGAGAVSGISLPSGYGSDYRVLRAFLQTPKLGAGAYVQNGLYAQWDGVDNAGPGLHDATLTQPVELKGNLENVTMSAGGTMPVDGDRAFLFGSGYLTFEAPELIDALNRGDATVEFVLAENGNFVHNGGMIRCGETSRALCLYQQKNASVNGMINGYSYHARTSGDYSNLNLFPQGSVGTNTFSFALGTTKESTSVLTNGVVAFAELNRWKTDCTDNVCSFGGLLTSDGKWKMPNAKVFSVRLYTRKLSAEELAANVRVDELRFRLPLEPSPSVYAPAPLRVERVVRKNGRPVSADLSFGGSSRLRTLYLACGNRDAGSTMSDWPQAVRVCEVPAGETSLAGVVFPAEVSSALSASGGFRFFLQPWSASSYVQDGLYAQWDGIENAGDGCFDASRTCPAELKGNISPVLSGTMPVDGNGFLFGSGDLSFTSSEIIRSLNEGHATLEMVLAENGDFVQNGGFFCCGTASRAFWCYQQAEGLVRAYSYHAAPSGEYTNINWCPAGSGGTNTLSFALGGDSSYGSFWATNGESEAYLSRKTTDCDESDTCYLGALYLPKLVRPQAKGFSIRIYNRQLTWDEVKANAAIDEDRFRQDLSSVSDYQETSNGLILIFR